ncbi:hypothetical protein [Mesorhizobium sp. 128a]
MNKFATQAAASDTVSGDMALVRRAMAREAGAFRAKVEAIFTNLARVAKNPKWKGCGFLRTAAELASMPGHPAVKAGSRHKKNFETWLTGELSGHGVAEPQTLAREIVLLMDGAFSIMLIHRNPDYVEAAGYAAATLVRARSGRNTGS